MKISKFLKIMSSLFIVLIIGIITSILSLNNAFKESQQATMRELRSKELGIELKEASGYLTEEIQNYVQFGEKKYYDNYWKEINETKTRDKVLTELKKLNIPDELIDMVISAKSNSDSLVKLEEEAMLAIEQGDFETARKLIFSSNYKDSVEKINTPIYQFLDKMDELVTQDANKATTKLNTMIIIISILITIACGLIIYTFIVLGKKIGKLGEVSDKLKELSNNEGDLTARVHIDSNDEIGEIAHSFNSTLERLQELIKEINYTSTEVNVKSDEFKKMTNIAKEGNEQIAATMQEMAAGSEEQANLSSNVAHSTKELNDFIELLKIDGSDLSDSSGLVLGITEEGTTQMEKTVGQVILVNDLIKDATEKIEKLGFKSQEISKLIQVINDIAEQTNLLSLNAAIEAARAGETGRGFAVVAEEIRKLSDQVGESVNDITTIVKDIQNETVVMTNVLEKGYQEVEEGTNQIKATGETFKQINEKVIDMSNKIQRIYDGLGQMSDNSSQINDGINNVATIIEESSAGIEEVAATVQEQSNSTEIIYEGASTLFELSNKLSNMVGKFKI